MDGQNYLNQISAKARPAKKASPGFLSSPLFKIIIGGAVAFTLIIIAGLILSTTRTSLANQSVALKYHIDNTLSVISSYQPSVKSSTLRSSSASLYSVLYDTSSQLTSYLVDTYKYKDGDKEFQTESDDAKLSQDALSQSLFEAKINGILDEVYKSKIAYEISSIMSEEASLYNATSNQEYESLLSTSYYSLKNLLPLFTDNVTP